MVQSLRELSKTLSHMLRHDPGHYGLELDEEGWASLDEVIALLRKRKWPSLTAQLIAEMIARSPKIRHEIKEGKIRALYGHSLPGKIGIEPSMPPEILYHGTSRRAEPHIREQGLLPSGRQYVHLSRDIDTAMAVGRRKDREPVILVIEALRAFEEGIRFYRVIESIWLADAVPPRFIAE
ncbi:MAG: RNA 2'-phosphotransferase [Candidatus Eremiobacteraeota bacterium]|nr:RNA 2'-phosphotransferase [Candidatus Eremiobacteraeota bacterium]